uniref:Uncharacterized protein n=1 Tax=Alexandrium monilatum TaxID=311494 RepID=A0A7S4UDN2_9DINO
MRRAHHTNWLEYLRSMRAVAMFSYLCYILSSLFWVFALSLMGIVYNDVSEYRTAEGGESLARHLSRVPIYAFWPCLGVCLLHFFCVFCLYQRSTTMSMETAGETEDGHTLADMAKQAVETASARGDSTMYLLGFMGAGLARGEEASPKAVSEARPLRLEEAGAGDVAREGLPRSSRRCGCAAPARAAH